MELLARTGSKFRVTAQTPRHLRKVTRKLRIKFDISNWILQTMCMNAPHELIRRDHAVIKHEARFIMVLLFDVR